MYEPDGKIPLSRRPLRDSTVVGMSVTLSAPHGELSATVLLKKIPSDVIVASPVDGCGSCVSRDGGDGCCGEHQGSEKMNHDVSSMWYQWVWER